MKILLKLLLLVGFLSPFQIYKETTSINLQIAGFTDSVELIVPKDFRLPSTNLEKEEAQFLLKGLNQTSNANYQYALMDSWQEIDGSTILISTLGTLKNLQGNITESNWNEMKQALSGYSQSELKSLAEEYRSNHNVPPFTGDHEYSIGNFVFTSHSITVFGDNLFEIDGEVKEIVTATKLIYSQGYIINVLVWVDKELQESHEIIKSYSSLIDFKHSELK